MQIRNYSPRTIDNYLASVARISVYYRISPDKLTGEQIKDYLQKRIDSGKFSPSAVNQLISALRILLVDVLGRKWEEFYIKRARREKRLPVVFSKEEIERLLDVTRNLKHKAIISLTYNAGLSIVRRLCSLPYLSHFKRQSHVTGKLYPNESHCPMFIPVSKFIFMKTTPSRTASDHHRRIRNNTKPISIGGSVQLRLIRHLKATR